MPYTPRPIPQTSLSPDSEVAKLSQYIDEEQRTIARAMQEVEQMQYTVLAVAPDRPREGMIAYSSGAWGGSGAGLYQFRNTLWRKLFDTYDGSVSYLRIDAPKFFAFSTGQGGFPHGAYAVAAFTSVHYNVGSLYDGGTAWYPPAGKIHVNAGFHAFPASGAAGDGAMAIYISGAYSSLKGFSPATHGVCTSTVAADFAVNGSQYIQVAAYTTTTTGATSTITSGSAWFSGHWLGT